MKESFPHPEEQGVDRVKANEINEVLEKARLIREKTDDWQPEDPSADLWHRLVMREGDSNDTDLLVQLVLAQQAETPQLVSVILERACNDQCLHCLYPKESSSAEISRRNDLFGVVKNIVGQLPEASDTYHPQFLSCGRILRPSHLELFAELRKLRPDLKLGIIDNGSYTNFLKRWPTDFRFDWMDISVDGTREAHNTQRASEKAFDQAMKGLQHAREVTRPRNEGGRVTSLFTLTAINAREIEKTADMLLGAGGDALVDQFRVTFMSPLQEASKPLEISVDELRDSWDSMRRICEKYKNGDSTARVGELGVYRMEDMEKLARVIGERKFIEAFSAGNETLLADANMLIAKIDGVEIQFQPLSIWPPEEFLIDANGALETARAPMYSLEELRTGVSKDGCNIHRYTVEQLTRESKFSDSFLHCVEHYWQYIGADILREEIAAWKRICRKAVEATPQNEPFGE